MKYKEELIIGSFLWHFCIPKWGWVIWTCVEDNVVSENEE